jgi:erythronate-4-phosphate dehydrogenase
VLKVVADQNIPMAAEVFSSFGEVQLVDGRSLCTGDLLGADVLLVRSVTKVNKDLLGGTSVRFVGSATAGFEHIDREYLRGQGIAFALASGANAQSVVEYVFAVLANIDDRLEALLSQEQTLGVVGCGNVGRKLIETARELGMRVKWFDPFVEPSECSSELDSVLRSDVVSLHCELTSDGLHPTHHLLNRARLEGFSRDQLLINAARGAVIDNAALLRLCEQGKSPQLVLDCWENEPRIEQQLIPFCRIATPHIAGYSTDGKWKATQMLFEAAAKQFDFESPSFGFPERESFFIETKLLAAEVIRESLFRVYDIKSDDLRFREAAEGNMNPQWFDDLRREYPVRRELANGRVRIARGSISDNVTKAFHLRLEE